MCANNLCIIRKDDREHLIPLNDSDCSVSIEAACDLVAALQSPHCRLTNFSVSGESPMMC